MPEVANPLPGFYKARLVRNGPWVPVQIWHGPPVDPVTGETLDRSWRLRAQVGDDFNEDPHEIWSYCAGHPIDRAEFQWRLADREWCKFHAPEDPIANPYRKIDVSKLPPAF